MNLRPLDVDAFFAPRHGRRILEQRERLLVETPEFYLAARPKAERGLELLHHFLRRWIPPEFRLLRQIGSAVEPDIVLLHREPSGNWLVVAGCVCFPTMWSLPEKIGTSLFATHDVVPGLNVQLGARIDQFLDRLSKAAAYGRENWGLAATDALDQHPRHRIPEIPKDVSLDHVWLRLEEQALVGLGENWVLFGIRVRHLRLDSLAEDRDLAGKLAFALETMTEATVKYKRLTDCRASLIEKLNSMADPSKDTSRSVH